MISYLPLESRVVEAKQFSMPETHFASRMLLCRLNLEFDHVMQGSRVRVSKEQGWEWYVGCWHL